MQYKLMRSHDYMDYYVYTRLGRVYLTTERSRRAVWMALLLMSEPNLNDDDDGPFLTTTASYSEIAIFAGITPETVQEALADLIDAEVIEVVNPGKGSKNTYELI